MQLRVTTENAQKGDDSIETVKVFDGDKLLVTVTKEGPKEAIVDQESMKNLSKPRRVRVGK